MSEDMVELLDELEEMLANSSRMPFVRRLMIDEEGVMAFLDRLRAAMPEEVRRARQILREREQILEQARRQAQRIAEQAKEEAALRLEEEGLLEEANQRSARILADARQDAERIRRGADQYAREVLTEIEARLTQSHREISETMARILASVRKGLASLDMGEYGGEEGED